MSIFRKRTEIRVEIPEVVPDKVTSHCLGFKTAEGDRLSHSIFMAEVNGRPVNLGSGLQPDDDGNCRVTVLLDQNLDRLSVLRFNIADVIDTSSTS